MLTCADQVFLLCLFQVTMPSDPSCGQADLLVEHLIEGVAQRIKSIVRNVLEKLPWLHRIRLVKISNQVSKKSVPCVRVIFRVYFFNSVKCFQTDCFVFSAADLPLVEHTFFTKVYHKLIA